MPGTAKNEENFAGRVELSVTQVPVNGKSLDL
jgi:hypothetical protein